MKKNSFYLNIVLLVAVAVLFYLHFSGHPKHGYFRQGAFNGTDSITSGIVYIDFDTLLIHYDYYTDLKKELLDKKDKLEAELTSKSKEFESEAKDFEDKVQKGLITRAKAQELRQELVQKEQGLYQLRDKLAQELMEEEQVMNRKLQYDILEYMDTYSKDKNFHYILSNTFGGALLYTKKDLNITQDVIQEINGNYKKNKK